jgi:hypothetical protein
MFDEPFGCGAEIEERVARHWRQITPWRGRPNLHIGRRYDFDIADGETMHPSGCFQGDDIVRPDQTERPEKRIAVGCNSYIAALNR